MRTIRKVRAKKFHVDFFTVVAILQNICELVSVISTAIMGASYPEERAARPRSASNFHIDAVASVNHIIPQTDHLTHWHHPSHER